MRNLLVFIFVVFVLQNRLLAQQLRQHNLLIGGWVSVEDNQSTLLFDRNNAYRTYGIDTIATYRYFIIDTTANRFFLKLESTEDSSNVEFFEIDNLTSKWLSLYDITHTKKNWLLKRKRNRNIRS